MSTQATIDGAQALAAARELLPAWVSWSRMLAPPLVVLGAQIATSALGVALLARTCGPTSALHWSERARRATNVLFRLRMLAWAVTLPALLIPPLWPSALDPVPAGVVTLVSLAALFVGAAVAGRVQGVWLLGRDVSVAQWVRESCALFLLSWPSLFAMAACMLFVGRDPGPWALALLLASTAVMLWFGLAGGWRLQRALGLARELDVAPLIGDAGRGRLFLEVELPFANAYALVIAGKVVVARRAREVLTDAQLAAVLQHELGHLAEPAKTRFARLLPLLLMLVLAWEQPVVGWLGPVVALLLVSGVWLAVAIAARRSRAKETAADAHAHEHSGDPRELAHALEALHRANLAPAVTHKARTHPHLYDRMLAAGVTPDFERPRATGATAPWVAALMALMVGAAIAVDRSTRPKYVAFREPAVLRALAIGGYTKEHLFTLAEVKDEQGDEAAAATFLAAAEELERSDAGERAKAKRTTR